MLLNLLEGKEIHKVVKKVEYHIKLKLRVFASNNGTSDDGDDIISYGGGDPTESSIIMYNGGMPPNVNPNADANNTEEYRQEMLMLAKNFFNMFMNQITNQVMNKLEAEETDDDYTAEEDPEE